MKLCAIHSIEPADPVAEEFMGSYPDYRYERLSELGNAI